MRRSYDLLVIGAGATGLSAARAARADGRSVALVEAERPGGDCTFSGCVPSKTLLETARRVQAARSGSSYGFHADVRVDFAAVMHRVHEVVEQIAQDESPDLLTSEGIALRRGWARFVGPTEVDVDGERLRGDRVVLALGARAVVPPLPGLSDVPHLDNRTVFGLTELPEHLLVLGGGAIGCELSQAFARLGAQVTVVEAEDRLLGKEEPEASAVLEAVLRRDGVDVRTGAKVERVSRSGDVTTLHLKGGAAVTGSHLLVVVGRAPATDGVGLEAAGVRLGEHGEVVTDATLRTTAEHVFAAGDCTSPLQLTHVGDEQGRLAAGNAFARARLPGVVGGAKEWDGSAVPWVTYTEPEIGRVGQSEAQAFAEHGSRARVAVVPLCRTDRARTAGDTAGFVKVVAAPRPVLRSKLLDRLVGMTAVGPVGGELVAEAALAMQLGTFAGRIAQTVHAYPTHSLATRTAVSRLFGTYAGGTARPAQEHPDPAEMRAVLGDAG